MNINGVADTYMHGKWLFGAFSLISALGTLASIPYALSLPSSADMRLCLSVGVIGGMAATATTALISRRLAHHEGEARKVVQFLAEWEIKQSIDQAQKATRIKEELARLATLRLTISPKLFQKGTDDTLRLVFTQSLLQLDLKKPCDCTADDETDPEKISLMLNKLQKPLFNNLAEFRILHARLKQLNSTLTCKIDLEAFVQKLSPQAQELGSSIWAVHATQIVPQGGKLTPCIRLALQGVQEHCDTPPGATLHFSLGELVRPHTQIQTWEHFPVAIITPLSDIAPQVVSYCTQDTTVYGEWRMSTKTLFIAPEGTTVPDGVYTKVFYNPDRVSLRQAISTAIDERGGLPITMFNQTQYAGSRALIDGSININTPTFFHHLLTAQAGFGSHTDSIIGESYCFRYMSACFMYIEKCNYTNHAYYAMTHFSYKKAAHRLPRAEQERALALLNRMRSGVSGAGPMSAMLFHALTWDELESLKREHPVSFGSYNQYELEAQWAIFRWVMIGDERARAEGLPAILENMLTRFLTFPYHPYGPHPEIFIDYISRSLDEGSTAWQTLLPILNLPIVQRYLTYMKGIGAPLFESTNLSSLEDLIRAHPTTAPYARGPTAASLLEQYQRLHPAALAILLKILPIPLCTDKRVLQRSFNSTIDALKFIRETPQALLEIAKPIKTSNPYGLFKTYYYTGAALFKRLGLERAYHRKFPRDTDFWSSNQSLLQIVQELQG